MNNSLLVETISTLDEIKRDLLRIRHMLLIKNENNQFHIRDWRIL